MGDRIERIAGNGPDELVIDLAMDSQGLLLNGQRMR